MNFIKNWNQKMENEDLIIKTNFLQTSHQILEVNSVPLSNTRKKPLQITQNAQTKFYDEIETLYKTILASQSQFQNQFQSLQEYIASNFANINISSSPPSSRPSPKLRHNHNKSIGKKGQKYVLSPHFPNEKPISERSVVKPTLQENEDPRNIWVCSAPFFNKIPELSELDQILTQEPPDQEVLFNQPICNDWSKNFSSIVEKLQAEGGSYRKLVKPPPPSPKPDEIAPFWQKNPNCLMVPEMQKQHQSSLHLLLSAFVPIEKDSQKEENYSNKATQTIPENTENFFLPSLGIMPYGDFGYSAQPFDVRINSELKSAGLVDDIEETSQDIFGEEIEKSKRELMELKPALEKLTSQLYKEYPKYIEIQQKLIEDQEHAKEILDPNKKKKKLISK